VLTKESISAMLFGHFQGFSDSLSIALHNSRNFLSNCSRSSLDGLHELLTSLRLIRGVFRHNLVGAVGPSAVAIPVPNARITTNAMLVANAHPHATM